MFSGVVLVGAGDGLADFLGVEVGELTFGKCKGFGFGDAGTVGVAGEQVDEIIAFAGGVGGFGLGLGKNSLQTVFQVLSEDDKR